MAPEPFNNLTPEIAASSTNLPAIIPSANALIQRTQTTLGLLRDVAQESSAEYWFERGKEAEASPQWAEAAYAYRQCVERNTKHWRGTVRLAAVLGHLGHAEAAARALIEASEAALEGWYVLEEELSQPTWQLLHGCLEAARSTAQNGFGLLLGLALVYRALNQREQARRTLDVMPFMYHQQVAKSAQWYRLSGNLYSDACLLPRERLYTRAITEYDKAIELKPDSAVAYFDRGSAKRSLKDDRWDRDIADYDRAIELEPGFTKAYFGRAGAKAGYCDLAGAIADYDRGLALKPDDMLEQIFRELVQEDLDEEKSDDVTRVEAD